MTSRRPQPPDPAEDVLVNRHATSHPHEDTDPDCLAPDALARLLKHVDGHRMVVVGDSVAAGIREPLAGYRDRSFADRVGDGFAHTRAAFAYRNLGVRDLRLAQIRKTQLDAALAFGPDLALVAAGGNDALARSFDPDTIHDELQALAAPLAAHGAQIVTIGLFDLARSGLVPERYAHVMAERFDLLDEITADVCARLGGIHVDCHHHPRAADPGIFSSDRIHANARGHAIAATVIATTLAETLGGPPPHPPPDLIR